jgi:hypothetical protein
MSETTLSFSASASFRNNLMGRNLPPYNVPGSYSPPSGDVNYEATPLSDSSVIDSPNDLIGTSVQANELYPLNEWGPEGGFNNIVSTDGPPLPVNSNQGEYGQDDAQIDLINEFFIDVAYLKNIYGPSDGYKDLITITDLVQNSQFFLPYSNNFGTPIVFNPSVYTPIQILLEDNPQGSNGPLSQDSELARRGAIALREEFQKRIEFETQQLVSSVFQLDQLQDPFEASLVATGQQPLIGKNWKITVPENPLLAAVSFINRITGTYFPVSPIPGDYFDETTQFISPQTENALNVANNLTGGFLGPILNKYRNPSEIFLANTGYGQKSVLFKSIEYNIYRPSYNKGLLLGVTSAISNLLGLNQPNGGGGYYVGSDQAEPSTINSPVNEVPIDRFGKQQPSPVYGPSDLAKLYEGNEDKIKFGLAGKSYSNQGGIAGQFVWTSPKYKDNLGFKVKPGGDPVQPQDQEFSAVKSEFNQDTQSSDFEFKGGSILDNTQRLINAADNVTGVRRLQHVGNAINQVSKVFNDGYKEMTKGSQVIAYYDSTNTSSNTIGLNGMEVGAEYCRVFQKDTPYLTYADLQKTDGITTSGRKFSNSVLDNTYNLNIAPIRNPGSTNIIDGKVKKYMFSLENLAWRTSSEPGFTYSDLPDCEKGPNGGRIMWFPPYNLTFSDSSTANWNPTSFLGRPEPIYTYKNTTRSGQISWMIIVDSPAMMNTIVEKQLANMSAEQVDSIMNSFFAGCVKYDLYDLAAKYNTIKTSDLYQIQQEIIQSQRSTTEEVLAATDEINGGQSVSTGGANSAAEGGGSTKTQPETTSSQGQKTKSDSDPQKTITEGSLSEYEGYGFYFDNDAPIGSPSNEVTNSEKYDKWYGDYIGVKNTYTTSANVPTEVRVGSTVYSKNGIGSFFDTVITGNFNKIKEEFLPVKLKEVLEQGAKVRIDIVGSASASASPDYNINLSRRRNSTVENWLNDQTVGGKKIKDWRTEGKLTLNFDPKGENISIPKVNSPDQTLIKAPIECTVDIVDVSKNISTKFAQKYSIPAMACRRVLISKIIVSPSETTKWTCGPNNDGKCVQSADGTYGSQAECEQSGECKKTEPKLFFDCGGEGQPCVNVPDGTGQFATLEDCNKNCSTQTDYNCVDKVCIPTPKGTGEYKSLAACIADGCTPRETITRTITEEKINLVEKVKKSISKKVLAKLFSECDYFELIKETNPMVYSSIKDKVKYFSPAFHSTTPEGLNARLTFLNQCVRPGQTIPTIDQDGNPKYNDARNTSFGSPPVLVLRIGDFYHTKIIPNQLSITYEPLIYDINPEGIGVQPMIAKVSLGFDFIGGHGLAGPVNQLQNALSFNFYGNTEIYDERSISTEDTTEKDEKLVAKIVNKGGAESQSNPASINNLPQGNRGGSTIGTVLTTENFEDGTVQTGTTEFKSILKELSDKTTGYFTTIFNQIKTLNETTNYPITQLALLDNKFNKGNLNEYNTNFQVETFILGKSFKVEDNLIKLFNKALKDIDDKDNPIIAAINKPNSNWSNATRRDVKNSLYSIVQEKQTQVIENVVGVLNTITKYQEDYVQVFRKMDLISFKIDGYKLDTGEYKVYTLSATTENPVDVFNNIDKIYPKKISKELKGYNEDLLNSKIISPDILSKPPLNFKPIGTTFIPDNEFNTRFYMVMSDVFVDDNKFNAFVDKLLTDQVKGNSDLVAVIRDECNKLKVQYVKENQAEKKIFTEFENSEVYNKYKTFKTDEFDSKVKYTTQKDNTTKDKQKLLKKTYSDLNVNNKKDTFNGKITFN